MALAEKGTNAHVDTMRAGAITKSEDSKEEDDAYSAFRDRKSLPEPRPIFMFGQGVTTSPGNRSLPEPKQLSLHMHATRESKSTFEERFPLSIGVNRFQENDVKCPTSRQPT